MVKMFFKGDNIKWHEDFPSYNSQDYTAIYYFASNRYFTNVRAVSKKSGGFDFAINSEEWAAGLYNYQLKMVHKKEKTVQTIKTGQIKVFANISTQEGIEEQDSLESKAVNIIRAIDAYLLNPKNLAAASIMILDKQITRYRPSELLELRKYYTRILNDEERKKNKTPFISQRKIITIARY